MNNLLVRACLTKNSSAAAAALAIAASACICTGATNAPPLQPAATQSNIPVSTPSGNLPGIQATELTPDQIDQISRASVEIVAMQPNGSSLEPMWSGSGTIISPDGEILTNCHVVCGVPILMILITTNVDQPPEPAFMAEITHYDEQLDLALLRVISDENGNPVTPANLPYIEVGDSNGLRLGDKLYIFGYPGVGGTTITFTTGSVSGFESANVGGQNQRVIIKTDADIAGGNSGGTAVDLNGRLVAIPTAVNPDIREGVTLGGIAMLRPVNLAQVIRQQAGAPPIGSIDLPPSNDPDPNEPNDERATATGPLVSGKTVSGYISWDQDVDFYIVNASTTQPISVALDGPSGTDYDLFLVGEGNTILASSESESSRESIQYSPSSAGTYWIAVAAYSGATASSSYSLTATFDGGVGGGSTSGIRISGQVIDGDTGQPLSGGTFGIITPGVSCAQMFGHSKLDLSKVIVSSETNSQGRFTLNGVPVGQTYSAFFLYETLDPICEDNWLDVPSDAVDSDLGEITISGN